MNASRLNFVHDWSSTMGLHDCSNWSCCHQLSYRVIPTNLLLLNSYNLFIYTRAWSFCFLTWFCGFCLSCKTVMLLPFETFEHEKSLDHTLPGPLTLFAKVKSLCNGELDICLSLVLSVAIEDGWEFLPILIALLFASIQQQCIWLQTASGTLCYENGSFHKVTRTSYDPGHPWYAQEQPEPSW